MVNVWGNGWLQILHGSLFGKESDMIHQQGTVNSVLAYENPFGLLYARRGSVALCSCNTESQKMWLQMAKLVLLAYRVIGRFVRIAVVSFDQIGQRCRQANT